MQKLHSLQNHRLEAGAFEEQNAHSTDDKSQYGDEQEGESSEGDDGSDMGRQIEDSNSESLGSNHSGQQLGRQHSSRSAHESELISPKRGATSFDRISASAYPRQRAERRVPRIAAFLTVMSRPRQRLFKAVAAGDFSKALDILKDETLSHVLDSGTLDRALWSATCQGEIRGSYHLLAELITRGGNVNYVSSDISERTPLWYTVVNGSLETVKLLVESGVDVNYKGSSRKSAWNEARDFAPRAALKQNIAMLRLLIYSGVRVKVLYTVHLRAIGDPIVEGEISFIHEAASLGAVSAIAVLLEYGVEIDAKSPTYGTALMVALSRRQEEAAEFLLSRGANPNFNADSDINYRTWKRQDYCWDPIDAAIVGENHPW